MGSAQSTAGTTTVASCQGNSGFDCLTVGGGLWSLLASSSIGRMSNKYICRIKIIISNYLKVLPQFKPSRGLARFFYGSLSIIVTVIIEYRCVFVAFSYARPCCIIYYIHCFGTYFKGGTGFIFSIPTYSQSSHFYSSQKWMDVVPQMLEMKILPPPVK